ncbi:MAG TPA: hypothetical protein VF250_11110 [Conexibacter sp.]
MTTIVAAAVLGVTVGAASAGRLSLSSQSFRAVWSEMTFNGNPCEIILEGTFHSRTFRKVAGLLIGSITRVTIVEATCRRITPLAVSLPWSIQYEGFTGTLPNITTIRAKIIGLSILMRDVEFFGAPNECLWLTTEGHPLRIEIVRAAGGTLTSVRPTPIQPAIPWLFELRRGLCDDLLIGESSESLTVLGAATLITMLLI